MTTTHPAAPAGTSGATDEQIEAARQRALDANDWADRCQECGLRAVDWASFLVPPDHIIVPAARVPDAAVIEAIKAVLADYRYLCGDGEHGWSDGGTADYVSMAKIIDAYLAGVPTDEQ